MKRQYLSRIYFFYLAVFFTVCIGISAIAISYLEDNFKSYISDSLQGILLTVQQATQVYVEGRENYIKAIASSKDVIENTKLLNDAYKKRDIEQQKFALENLRNYLLPILRSNGDLGFFIINKERISLASLRDQNIGKLNLIEKSHPKKLEAAFNGKTLITPPITSDVRLKNQYGVLVDNALTMFIITPVIEENGDINNVMTIRVNPRLHFTKLTELGRIGESGETYAFDKQAKMITQSRFSSQLQRTHLQPLYGNDDIKLSDPGINLIKNPPSNFTTQEMPLTWMAAHATQGNSGINIDGYRDYRGVNVVGAWLWVPKLQIGFATEIDFDEAMYPHKNTMTAFAWVILGIVSVCFILLSVIWKMRRKWQLQTLRLNKALEKKVKIRTKHLEKTKAELNKAMINLEETAATDALTQVANRRHFDTIFEIEWKRCIRDKKAIAIILLDVDYFKPYNDNYGHLAGDNCLIELADFLKNADITSRSGDVVARYGGEKFIVLLSDVTYDNALQVANSIHVGINQLAITHFHREDDTSHVTASIGISYSDALYRIYPNMLIDNADKALYQAKNAGRNQIVTYDSHEALAYQKSAINS